MPINPYNNEYERTASMISNYSGDLDDLLLDTDDFDNNEQISFAPAEQKFHTIEDELSGLDDEENAQIDFEIDEASEELNEDSLENSYDARIDMMLDRAVARINPQRINAIASENVMESTFVIPHRNKDVKSLSQYVKTIQESFDKYIDEKITNYSK